VRALYETHAAATYPEGLSEAAEVDGVALVLLEGDIAALAEAYLRADGRLRPDQWWTLRASAADARTVVPQLTGDAWVHFGRLYALARAMLADAGDA
jgi:hypothetical protein